MDPLTLLRELFGEEPIRKVVTSGFDSAHKIAAATPESLSFFSGLNEALARQIVASAEESLTGPASAAYRGSLTGATSGEEMPETVLPVKPRVPPAPKAQTLREETVSMNPLDDDGLLLDAAGIMKTVAQEPRPKEILSPKDFMSDEELLDQVGISDAEANFLEGISPWPGGTPRREKVSPGEEEPEYAPVSTWSPEEDPEPVPRLIRAPELGPAPPATETAEEAKTADESAVSRLTVESPEPVAKDLSLEDGLRIVLELASKELSSTEGFWRFGK